MGPFSEGGRWDSAIVPALHCTRQIVDKTQPSRLHMAASVSVHAPCSEWMVHAMGPCDSERAACLQVGSVFGDASFQKDDGSAKLEPSLWDTLMTAYAR